MIILTFDTLQIRHVAVTPLSYVNRVCMCTPELSSILVTGVLIDSMLIMCTSRPKCCLWCHHKNKIGLKVVKLHSSVLCLCYYSLVVFTFSCKKPDSVRFSSDQAMAVICVSRSITKLQLSLQLVESRWGRIACPNVYQCVYLCVYR